MKLKRLYIATLFGLMATCNTQVVGQDLGVPTAGPQSSGGLAFQGEERWWKGNTHTHTWWSDGDAPPELIADWYKKNDYQFLVFSDHNIMQSGQKWYPIDEPPRPIEQVQAAYKNYVDAFGDDWVEERTVNGKREVKLKTLSEFRSLFEVADNFIFLVGEEITDSFQRHPIHMNGVNLVELIRPQGGSSIGDTIQNNLDAVMRQSEEYRQPMVFHLNHPNFHYAVAAEDFFHLEHETGDGFFEIYNGHSGVDNHGDELHVSSERMWDIVLSKRLGELGQSMMYGVAVDDSHEYTRWGIGAVNPGRGWIMVKSKWLTPNKITEAIKRGDFYNSTGVTLSQLHVGDGRIAVEIEAEPGLEYRVEFVGTLQSADLTGRPQPSTSTEHEHRGNAEHLHQVVTTYSDEVGEVLKTVSGTSAEYVATGNEIYVRARIISSRIQDNPFAEGDVEMAWTQPLQVQQN